MQPTFISSVTPDTKPAEPWSTDPPVHVSSRTPSFNSKDKNPPTVQVSDVQVGGASPEGGVVHQGAMALSADQREEELRSSFSPHRTLSQPPSSEAATLEQSGSERLVQSGSHSPQSQLALPGSEVMQDEDGDDALVERKSKSKSSKDKSKKKKKKKKKPKSDDLADSKAPELGSKAPAAAAVVSDDWATAVANGDGDVQVTASGDQPLPGGTDSRMDAGGDGSGSASKPRPAVGEEVTMARVEADDGGGENEATSNPFGLGDSPRAGGNPFAAEGAEEGAQDSEERTQITYRVKKMRQPWEEEGEGDWTPTEDGGPNFTPPAHHQGSLGEYMEECDMGFGKGVEPLPLPQQGASKRLSLADELEMAMEEEITPPAAAGNQQEVTSSEPHPSILQPSGGEEQEEQATVGATPPTGSTPSSSQSSTHRLEGEIDSRLGLGSLHKDCSSANAIRRLSTLGNALCDGVLNWFYLLEYIVCCVW